VPSTLTVTSAADSGAGSLRADIAAAQPGDTIAFAPNLAGQTITLTSGELNITKGLTIQGPGANQLTISGNGTSREFEVNASQPVVLSGLTLTRGNGGLDGGAIYNHTTLTINNCNIVSNQANYGGGIFSRGTLAVNNSVVAADLATYSGGGIVYDGTLTLRDSTFYHDKAQLGEAGGIKSNATNSQLTANGCTLYDNVAGDSGGGMWLAGTITLTNCTLSSNTAYGQVNGNVPPAGGGGIYVDWGPTTLTNCTVSLNSCNGLGSGINVIRSGVLNLTNTIVAGNLSRNNSLGDINGIVTTADHNLVGNVLGSSGLVNGSGGNLVGGGRNPVLNAELGPLQDNGGPTETMALLADSPALGQADNSKAPATDQRGDTRMDQSGETTDIGAFEL